MKPRNIKRRRKKPESRETQYMCILLLLMFVGIIHVLTHQNEMSYIRNSYALRGIMRSGMSKLGGFLDLETKAQHELTSNFSIDKAFENSLSTHHEFRDTNTNYQRTTTLAKVLIHTTPAAPESSTNGNSLQKETSKKSEKCKEFGFHVIKDHDIQEFDLYSKAGSTIDDCCEYCKTTLSCQAVVFSGGDRCWLKKSAAHLIYFFLLLLCFPLLYCIIN